MIITTNTTFLIRLHYWRFSGNQLKSFLRDRTFRVRAGQSLSAPHELENRLHQRSPLNGTRFTIAINGIFEGIETLVGKFLYADDLALFYSVKATAIVKDKMQSAIDALVENANNIGFSFSATKTRLVSTSVESERAIRTLR